MATRTGPPWKRTQASICLEKVVDLLDGKEWNADTLDEIARVLLTYGYVLRDCYYPPTKGVDKP